MQEPCITEIKPFSPSVISGSHREVDEKCALLGYNSTSSGNSLPTFRDNLSVPSSRVRDIFGFLGFLTLEDGIDRLYRNVDKEERTSHSFFLPYLTAHCFSAFNHNRLVSVSYESPFSTTFFQTLSMLSLVCIKATWIQIFYQQFIQAASITIASLMRLANHILVTPVV